MLEGRVREQLRTPLHGVVRPRVCPTLARVQRAVFPQVVRLLHEFRPHVIINTHFLPAEVVAELASRYGLTTPQLTVITDFDVARSWVHEPTSHYFVAREEAGKVLEHFGVRSARITVSGVPIMPDYEDVAKKRRAAVMADLELGVLLDVRAAGASLTSPSREDLKPIVVIEPTGRAMKEVLKHTLETHHPLEVVALVGSTAQSRGDLAGLRVPLQHTLHLRAATKRLPELLRIASLYVGKPSTLSVAECLALGTPMALVEPCAGQEARNGDMLLMAGAAIRVHEPCLLPFSVDALLENGGGRLRELRERCRLMGRPRASAIIAAHALALSSLPLPRRRSSQLPLDVLQPPRESNRSLVLSPPRTPRSGDGDADGSSRRSGRMDPVRTKAAAVAEPQMASPQFRVPTASRHQPKRTAGAAADGPGAPGMLMGNGEHGLSPGLRMHGGAGSGLVFPVLPSLFVSSPLRDTTISTSPLTMVEGNSFDDPTCVSPSDMTADFTHNATLCELLEGMPLAGPGASGRGSMPLNDNLFTYR
eukprot:jgi/Mesvir1/15954/Mv26461-RA.2